MDFNNQFPEWKEEGVEPSTDLLSSGFQGGYKPPATVFNWFWSKVMKAITEIQTKMNSLTKADVGLSEVDNTSDILKPISMAMRSELDMKANYKTEGGGFTAGDGASSEDSAVAIGSAAASKNGGGAVGSNAKTNAGGAVGLGAMAYNYGGAVGNGAVSGEGFSGGYNAKVSTMNGYSQRYIDAIQLGTGTNPHEKTLQVYDYQLMGADGKIPTERLPGLQATPVSDTEIDQTITATGLYYVTATTPYIVYHKDGGNNYDLYQIKIDGEAVYTRHGEIQRYGEHVWDGWKPYATEQYVNSAIDEKLEEKTTSSYYYGDGSLTNSHFSNLGYKPRLVLISNTESNSGLMTWHVLSEALYTAGYYAPDSSATCDVAWEGNGFTITHVNSAELAANADGIFYSYIIYK